MSILFKSITFTITMFLTIGIHAASWAFLNGFIMNSSLAVKTAGLGTLTVIITASLLYLVRYFLVSRNKIISTSIKRGTGWGSLIAWIYLIFAGTISAVMS